MLGLNLFSGKGIGGCLLGVLAGLALAGLVGANDTTTEVEPNATSEENPAKSERTEKLTELESYLDRSIFAQEQKDGYWGWMITQRNSWSNDVVSLGRYIDSFLGGNEAYRQTNESFFKLGFFGRWLEGREFDADPRVKFRLDLPSTKDKYRLVIENQSTDTLSPEERNRDSVVTALNSPNTPTSGFLRILGDLEDWKLKADLGVRFSSPISPFLRGRAERTWILDPLWSLRAETQPFYYVTDGFGFSQVVNFDRLISHRALLRFRSEAQWLEENKFWQFAEVVSYSRRLSNRAVMSQSVGWAGQNKPRLQTTSYYTNITYRYRLYRDWLFAEATPEVVWARETGFADDTSLTIGLEVLFMR